MNINKALFSFIKIAFLVMVLLLIVYATIHLSKTGYEYGYRLFTETAVDEAPGEDVLVQVKPDMSNRQIAQMLEEKGLVRDSKLFYLQLKLSAYSHSIQPGVYTQYVDDAEGTDDGNGAGRVYRKYGIDGKRDRSCACNRG